MLDELSENRIFIKALEKLFGHLLRVNELVLGKRGTSAVNT